MLCQGKRRATGEPCRNKALAGRRYCRVHGGHNPVGPLNGHWKGGRWSRFLPAHLAERAGLSATDPNLLDLSADIGAVDARLSELMESLATGGAALSWVEVAASWERVSAAYTERDAPALAAAMTAHGELVRARTASGIEQTWAEIRAGLLDRARLVSVEIRRRQAAADAITAEEAVALVTTIVEVVREHVTDRKARTAIAAAVDRIAPDPLR